MKYISQIAWAAPSAEERQKQCSGESMSYSYSRDRDPIRDRLVDLLGSLQGATGGFAVASGMAALNLVINALVPLEDKHNSRPLVIYGKGIHYECAERIQELGVRFGFESLSLETYDSSLLSRELNQIHDSHRIKLMWIEPLENPCLGVTDIRQVNCVLKSIAPHSLLVSDNTSLPCFQHSLKHGADVEVISLAKYHGQGTVNGGLVLTRNREIEKILYDENSYLGAILGSQDALEIIERFPGICNRLKQHCRSAEMIAGLLDSHSAIKAVSYPKILGSCHGANKDIVEQQMNGMGGGIISFELYGGFDAGKRLMSLTGALQENIFIQPTFGMPTTHLEHFASIVPPPLSTIITPGLCRLSVGLKSPDKIWLALKRLLDQL